MAKRNPLAECAETGKLYIEAGAIMSPLCMVADALTFMRFGKSSILYIDIETAIEWCRKEGMDHNKKLYDQAVEKLEELKATHDEYLKNRPEELDQ